MTDAIIDRLSPTDVDTAAHLYNQIFRPTQDAEWIRRRIEGRRNVLIQVARIGHDAVGFYIGFEHKPDTLFTWLVGVMPDIRRSGIATQLMHAAEDFARTEGYKCIRFECDNRIRPFLHFGIANNYDVVGIRWDTERLSNLVIFERPILEQSTDNTNH